MERYAGIAKEAIIKGTPPHEYWDKSGMTRGVMTFRSIADVIDKELRSRVGEVSGPKIEINDDGEYPVQAIWSATTTYTRQRNPETFRDLRVKVRRLRLQLPESASVNTNVRLLYNVKDHGFEFRAKAGEIKTTPLGTDVRIEEEMGEELYVDVHYFCEYIEMAIEREGRGVLKEDDRDWEDNIFITKYKVPDDYQIAIPKDAYDRLQLIEETDFDKLIPTTD